MKENHIQISLPMRVIAEIEKRAQKKGLTKGLYVKMLLIERFDPAIKKERRQNGKRG